MPESEEQEFTTNAKLIVEENEDGEKTYKIVAAIGDRFMNGGFLPKETLKKSTKLWNGTLHDINHQGIGAWEMNILFFIGYHSDAKFNDKTNELTMTINIDPNTKFAKDWEAYINLCENAGLIPNVSTTYRAAISYKKANELPVNYKDYGYNKDDLVPYLDEILPAAVSTVVIGRCSDKDGCGIMKKESCDCGSCITKVENPDKEEEEKQQRRKELIQKIKEMEDK